MNNSAQQSRLDGVTAVVTGASRGIGAAIARSFAAAGARVALVARDAGSLAELATEIGGGAFAVPCDVTRSDLVPAAVKQINATFNAPVKILVNNAGLFRVGAAHLLPEADLMSMLEVNLVAPHMFVREFLPAMLAAKAGHVVTIGSVADRTAYAGNAGYSATKFGVRAMHEILRAEIRGTGVRASLVSPSATDTPIWNLLAPAQREKFPKAEEMLRPEDVAAAVLYAVTAPPTVNVDELRLTRA